VRLRLVLPRRRRRAGQRRLRRPLLGAVAALLLLAGCGGAGHPPESRTAPAPPRPAPAAPPPGLAVGITESDPHLLAPGPWGAPFGGLARQLAGLRPAYVRVLVDWSHLQPSAATPPAFDTPVDGCMRLFGPCSGWAGLAATLRAVHELGAQPVLDVYGTPAWAATRVPGCERVGATDYARMPDVAAYRAFVRALLALGQREGIALPWWSAWNEPNLAGFLNPQRAACAVGAPAVSPGLYLQLVRAMGAELDAAPGVQRMLLGEAAGLVAPGPKAVSAAELAAALPDDVVCGSVWAQHAYLLRIRRNGQQIAPVPAEETDALLAGVEQALDGHHCARPVPIWITETGIGDQPGGCATMGARLEAWARDPRIRAAFQYTFREDPVFPVGLVDPALTTVFPAYGAWTARGASGCA
jgi:hypothetical protein